MKTNKQNKTNKKADQASGSELKNRTEQLSEIEPAAAKTPEAETANGTGKSGDRHPKRTRKTVREFCGTGFQPLPAG